jgi:CheY-like chemotaxis protein
MIGTEEERELPFPMTVLYVEDDADTRELTRFFLESYFTRVLTAETGEEALKIFFDTPKIDVVLTDLSLPGFDGLEMLRRMKKRQEDLAIVIFSAYTESTLMLQAIELQVDGYLVKPFDPVKFESTIVASVERLLSRREERLYRKTLEERLRQLEEECGETQRR